MLQYVMDPTASAFTLASQLASFQLVPRLIDLLWKSAICSKPANNRCTDLSGTYRHHYTCCDEIGSIIRYVAI